MDDATSRAREMLLEIIRDHYHPAEFQDAEPLADSLLYHIARYHWAIIDTRTHAAIPREPSEEVVERVARAIFDDDWCARDRHGTNAIARAAIAALVQEQTQGGERDAPV